MSQTDSAQQSDQGALPVWPLLALALALAGVAGSLLLSLALGLRACPLCFYQRSFAMGAFAVLLVGLVADRSRLGLASLLSLPLAFAGLGVAAFHEYLVLAGVLECPLGLFGMGTAPAQSLAFFVLLSAVLLLALLRGDGQQRRPLLAAGAAVLGLLLAWGAIASSPPLPAAPAAPYDPVEQPLEMCRPPYRGEQ